MLGLCVHKHCSIEQLGVSKAFGSKEAYIVIQIGYFAMVDTCMHSYESCSDMVACMHLNPWCVSRVS